MKTQRFMMLPTLLLLAPGLLAAPLTSSASGDETPAVEKQEPTTLRFDTVEGTRLLKTVTWTQELNLDEMGSTRSGSDLMRENLGGWLSSSMTKIYLDEYVKVADGRPQVLRRFIRNMMGHGKLNISGGRGRVEEKTLFKSPMKGLTLLLTWLEEEGEYARLYDVIDHEELLLKEITGDVDFIYMLPQKPVVAGDSWELDIEDMRSLLAPGGNLSATPTEVGFFPRTMELGIGGDLADVLGNRMGGSAVATYAGERLVDGRRLGVIDLTLDIASKRDRTGSYLAGMEKEERGEASSLKRVTIDFSLVATGHLYWNLDAGHYDSFELEGHESFRAEIFKTLSEGAETFEATQVAAFSGNLVLEYEQREMKNAEEHRLAEEAAAAAAATEKTEKTEKGEKQSPRKR